MAIGLLSSLTDPAALRNGSGLSGSAAKNSKEDIASAAQQFEALMLHQLLSSAKDSSSGGWMGTGEQDQAGLQAVEMAQEQFAQAMAARGGLGLARIITQQVKAGDK